jgi:outer membrane receptor protein involved in Fe transport
MHKFFRLSFVTLLVFALSAMAFAQSTTTGAIGLTVTDPQGAVVPNASITVRNIETNKESTATTDDEGRARVVNLEPGTYSVNITGSGFGTFTQEKVVVEVGNVTPLEVPLSVGSQTANVEVTSDAPVINTAQQDFATNINQTSINELPINGRRASDFVRLTPGVVADGNFGLNSFRGISGLLNNNTVDGGDNNNAFFGEERGRTRISYSISQSAVREFQVNTSNYSAEYGRAAGGAVNTVTKSGTNEFHGSLFYYIRDNRLGARNPGSFRNVIENGVPTRVGLKAHDRRQQFGGAIGGPIAKDKLFFFFSYDQQKRNFPGVADFASASFLDLSTANRATIRSNIISAFPAGTTNATLDAAIDNVRAGLLSLTGEVPRSQDQLILLPKIDWQINSSNTATFTYNRFRSQSPSGVESPAVVQQGVNSFGDNDVDVDTFIARLNSTLTPTVLNEFRFQWGREFDRAFQTDLTPFENSLAAKATLLPSTGRLPQVDLARSSVGIRFGQRQFLDRRKFPDERRLQFADTLTMVRGSHTLKFGLDINRTKDNVDNLFNGPGAYSYSSLINFISDVLDPADKRYTNFTQAFGLSAFSFQTTDYNFFVQDDIRVSPRLTVNLGLRYEYQKLPGVQFPNTLANSAAVGFGPEQTTSFPSDKNNFGPRIGFAYDITGDGKTSVRGGYGIYYGRIINSTISNALTNTGSPQGSTSLFFTPTTPGSPTFPNGVAAPAAGGGGGDIVALSTNMANPQIHQADLIFEREIARNTVVSASLLVSLGRRLPRFVDRNLSFPTTTRTFTIVGGDLNGQTFTTPVFLGTRPDTRFGRITEIQSGVKSEYQALVLQANRRLTKGLQFQTSYTLSKATDSGQSSVTFTTGNNVLNPFDIAQEGGRSNLDVPHRFVASAVWSPDFFGDDGDSRVGRALFGGFTIAPIVQIQSGRTVTPFVSGNLAGGTPGGGIIGAGGSARPFFLERNTFRQPKTAVVDLRLSRRFRFGETMNLEVLAEAFNLFNRSNVTGVADRLYSVGGTATAPTLTFDPTFLTPTDLSNATFLRERQIQLAVRFHF